MSLNNSILKSNKIHFKSNLPVTIFADFETCTVITEVPELVNDKTYK